MKRGWAPQALRTGLPGALVTVCMEGSSSQTPANSSFARRSLLRGDARPSPLLCHALHQGPGCCAVHWSLNMRVRPHREPASWHVAGTGKTLVARALAATASKAGRPVAFFMRKVLPPVSTGSGPGCDGRRLLCCPSNIACLFLEFLFLDRQQCGRHSWQVVVRVADGQRGGCSSTLQGVWQRNACRSPVPSAQDQKQQVLGLKSAIWLSCACPGLARACLMGCAMHREPMCCPNGWGKLRGSCACCLRKPGAASPPSSSLTRSMAWHR